ncbi:MAG: formamidopyrimidine-DNA glycosylase, partial [Planctomycetota bacterium]|nr:formamidopyrimidine-DNA glycosylase [Planctomycetota bacterium]
SVKTIEGRDVETVESIGKRIVLGLSGDLFMVIHLMVTGRLRWRKRGCIVPKKGGLAAFDFAHGAVLFTERGRKKKASLHVVSGRDALAEHDPGGIDVLACALDAFTAALTAGNHTLKRALTSPRRLSGIGGAYADEICWEARVSPLKWTSKLDATEIERLHRATKTVMTAFTERMREELGEKFPETVTAFRPDMAVHGKYKEACPRCGAPVQRIVYVQNETNYCAACQTGGKLLADRALSQLLKKDWPKTLEGWEELHRK